MDVWQMVQVVVVIALCVLAAHWLVQPRRCPECGERTLKEDAFDEWCSRCGYDTARSR